MELQKLYSRVRQAIEAYEMIEEGDKIALGISGGKDSLALLYALAGIRKFYPKKFELIAITVNLGYKEFDLTKVKELCEKLDVEYHIVDTEIYKYIEEGGCSLCARLRKGALYDRARELGVNKVAYAHNMDDVVETMMLSLIYEGRFHLFAPVTYLEDTGITLIRPFVFVTQAEAIGVMNKYELPVVSNPCPHDKTSERAYVRDLLKGINQHAKGSKKRMMTAIMTMPDWIPKNK